MLRLLIPSYPLPCPALMAFRLYLALLEFLLECILTLATTLFTSHHQHSCCLVLEQQDGNSAPIAS